MSHHARMPRSVRPDCLSGPFTLEQARAAGLTRHSLQSSAWCRVFRTVWVAADVPHSRQMRFAAARLILPPHAVICGLTAAWLYGVDVRHRDDLDVDVSFAKGRRLRTRPGLRVCQETLDAADVSTVDGIQVTTPLRTAFDCLRWLRGAERLVVADALTHAGLTDVDELCRYFAGKRRLRNLRIGERLLDLVEPRTESPMETRLRMVLVDAGLAPPHAQWEVRDAWGGLVGRLDLAYPDARIGIEYDGAEHWQQRRADDRRRAAIRELGWDVLVFSAEDVYSTPLETGAAVIRALRARAA